MKSVCKTTLVFAVLAIAVTIPSLSSWAQSQGIFKKTPDITFENLMVKVSTGSDWDNLQGIGKDLSDEKAMQDFYKAHDLKPLWTQTEANKARAEAALDVLEYSWTHGLNPEHYHLEKLKKLQPDSRSSAQAKFELLLSDAVVRYGQDLTGMRVDPEAIKQEARYWRQSKDALDILQQIAAAEDVAAAFDTMAPHGVLYKKLRQELVHLVEEKKSHKDDVAYDRPVDLGGGILEPNTGHKAVPYIRRKLGVTYDPVYGHERKYDDKLAAAVIAFQKRHGLEPDGKIGPKTVSLLNRTLEDRITQVVANLERLRWLEQERPDRYILVNIPSATLWAVENNQVKIEMPVVVGKSYRPTKSFKTDVTGVRFNPTWTVPLSLKMQDILPKVQKDRSYLDDKGITLYDGLGRNAKIINPRDIDWDHMTWKKMSTIQMVQSPGDHNALGRFRVLMENPYSIYMHDTNHRELFDRTDRNQSSGCIRLSRPDVLARFILSKNSNFNDEKMFKILDSIEMTDVAIPETLPAYILYQTIWLGQDEQLVFGHDVYKQDKALVEALSTKNAFFIPDSLSPEQASTVLASIK